MSPIRRFRDPRLPDRRAVRRVGDLLGDAARELGLEEELRWARAAMAWDEVVEAAIPGARGGSRPVRIEGEGTLVVQAAAPMIGQELRLRADELLDAFAARPDGIRAARLRVVMAQGMIRSPRDRRA